MKNIVFAMTGAARTSGGIASANLNVLVALDRLAQERGCGLRVLSLHEGNEARPEFLSEDSDFRGFQGGKIGFSVELVRMFRGDTLFVVDHVRLALPLAPLLAVARGRCVIMAHGSESWRRVRRSSRWLFRQASLCLANSHFTLRHMRRSLGGFNGTACPLGLSPRHSLNEEVPSACDSAIRLHAVDGVEREIGDRMILLVGRMDSRERRKGHAQLLDVWERVVKRFPDAQLVFAGPGDDHERYEVHARSIGGAACVFVCRFLPVDMLQALYRRCYAYVMPSSQEGFGLVYLEAMNFAKPCVGCHDDGGEDVIVDGVTGVLLRDPENREELTEVITRLLNSERDAKEMGLNGWKRLKEQFTAGHAQERVMTRMAGLL